MTRYRVISTRLGVVSVHPSRAAADAACERTGQTAFNHHHLSVMEVSDDRRFRL